MFWRCSIIISVGQYGKKKRLITILIKHLIRTPEPSFYTAKIAYFT